MMEYTKKNNNSIFLRSANTDASKAALRTSIYSTEGLSMGEDNSTYRYNGIQRSVNKI